MSNLAIVMCCAVSAWVCFMAGAEWERRRFRRKMRGQFGRVIAFPDGPAYPVAEGEDIRRGDMVALNGQRQAVLADRRTAERRRPESAR